MQFTWDLDKEKFNKKKHGISFQEAMTVFYDETAKLIKDPDHSNEEERFILIGYNNQAKLLIVIHVYVEEIELIRIISARKATKKERRDFEQLFKGD